MAVGTGLTVGTGLNVKSASADPLFSISEMISPVWEGKTSYNESVLVVSEADGSVAPSFVSAVAVGLSAIKMKAKKTKTNKK